MILNLNANIITKHFDMEELLFNTLASAARNIEVTCPINDCKGDIEVILDNSQTSAGAMTLTVYGGDGPAAMKDAEYTVPAGKISVITLSSGQVMNADGHWKGKIASNESLSALGAAIAVIERRYVTNH